MKFVLWYFSPDRDGTQEGWAKKNGVHRKTVSMWKRSEWFGEFTEHWRQTYGAEFADVVHTLHKKATDKDDWQAVPAARTLAELLGKFPKKEVQHTFSIAEYLKGEMKPKAIEGEFVALPAEVSGLTLAQLTLNSKEVSENGQRSQDDQQEV